MIRCTEYQVDNSSSDIMIYFVLDYDRHTRCTRQTVVRWEHTNYILPVHIQLLYGILYTTTSRPNANTSPITLYSGVCQFQSFFSFWIACDIANIDVDTKEQVARYNPPNIYIHTRKQTTKYSDAIPTTSGETMNMTGNYNYCCINNTTAVWNLTPPVYIALIPQQHVIHQASKYQSRYDIYR